MDDVKTTTMMMDLFKDYSWSDDGEEKNKQEKYN